MVVRLSRAAASSLPSQSATAALLLLVLSSTKTPIARGFGPPRTATSPAALGLASDDPMTDRRSRRKRRPQQHPTSGGGSVSRTVAASMVLVNPSELIGEDEDEVVSSLGSKTNADDAALSNPATDPVARIFQEQLVEPLLEAQNDIKLLNREASIATSVGGESTPKSLEGAPEKEQAGTYVSKSTYSPPKLRHIFKFAIPAIGVWLCGPLLSLIDTAAVGLLAGTCHQAALSPAVAVTDYTALLLAFLYAATTNLVATSSSASRASSSSSAVDGPTEPGGANTNATTDDVGTTLFSSLQLSLYVGLGIGSVLFAFAPTLLRTLIGRSTPIDPAIFNPAVLYVRIRALGFPAAAVLGSAQSACLGLKDIRSPMLVLGAAAIVNLVCDGLFVGSSWTLLHGAAGAAWATVLSQFAAVWLFLGLLKAKPSGSFFCSGAITKLKRAFRNRNDTTKVDSASEDDAPWSVRPMPSSRDRQDPKPSSIYSRKFAKKVTALFHHKTSAENGFNASGAEEAELFTPPAKSRISAKGFLSDRDDLHKRDILRAPSRKHWSKFLPYVLPVTTTSVGRVSLFLSMAHVVSSCMGSAGMAAQSIILALFEALCPVADSLSLTAQTFVPEALDHEMAVVSASGASSTTGAALSAITRQFLKAGLIFGAILVLVADCIPFISSIFTTDAAVVSQVNAIAPYLAGVFAMHGIVMACEGVLLGRRDINFLGWMYGGYFVCMPAIMMRIKHGVLSSSKVAGLKSIWAIFLGYQCSRMLLWVWRAMRPLKDPDTPPLATSEM